jgi:hypothetical protein
MSDIQTQSGGISFFGLLTIVFIVLKLVGTIDWSWWWVLSPIWFPVAVVLFIIVLGVLTQILKILFNHK